MKTWSEFNIVLPSSGGVEVDTECPQCGPTRKKKHVKCLSVNTEKGTWLCHHCDYRGSLKQGEEGAGRKLYRRPTPPTPKADMGALALMALARGLSMDVLTQEGVVEAVAYMPQLEDYVDCVCFPYVKNGHLVNVKYRAIQEKAFRQVGGAEKVLYRQDALKGATQAVIVEGEWDALAVVQVGVPTVVSVPDGAPPPTSKQYSAKFTYLDQEDDPFEGITDIVIAVDADAPGQRLEQELARRLGVDRCRRVRWPEGCKDANEVLRDYGADRLVQCLTNAEPFPVRDVVEMIDLMDELDAMRHGTAPRGISTGWANVDLYYTIATGQLTVVTGVPSSGKSEWLDALLLNLARKYEWRIGICSPENLPVPLHAAKLMEKVTGLPFFLGPTPRMSEQAYADAAQWLQDTVRFLAPEETLSIPQVLERASSLVRRYGIRALVLDPWNEFDHAREKYMTETEYVSLALSTLKRWARKHEAHVFLVAHPQKLYRKDDGTYPVPTPYDISGSAHFRNKADGCITIHRDFADPSAPVEVHVQKCRFKYLGKIGIARLIWDRVSGRYYDAPEWLNQNTPSSPS